MTPEFIQTSSKDLFPELKEHCNQLDAIKDEVAMMLKKIGHPGFNWKPSSDRWSVGECLDHLNVLGSKFIPEFEKAIAKGQERKKVGKPPFRYGILDKWFISYLEPSSKKKIKSPRIYKPAKSSLDKNETLRAFVKLQDDLKRIITKANGLNLKRIRVSSPAIHLLRLSLGAWFIAHIAHEKRHVLQMQRIISIPEFPIFQPKPLKQV